MQVKTLKELFCITLGYTFREVIEEDKNGGVRVIQARNISGVMFFQNTDELMTVSGDSIHSNSFVKNGEILLTSRGATVGGYKATIFSAESNLPVLASSSLYILHPTTENVFPEYFVIFLNSKEAQRELQEKSTGATIRSIPRRELENLRIPIPPIEIQKTIVELYRNIRKQERLLKQKTEVTKKIFDATFKEIIKIYD